MDKMKMLGRNLIVFLVPFIHFMLCFIWNLSNQEALFIGASFKGLSYTDLSLCSSIFQGIGLALMMYLLLTRMPKSTRLLMAVNSILLLYLCFMSKAPASFVTYVDLFNLSFMQAKYNLLMYAVLQLLFLGLYYVSFIVHKLSISIATKEADMKITQIVTETATKQSDSGKSAVKESLPNEDILWSDRK